MSSDFNANFRLPSLKKETVDIIQKRAKMLVNKANELAPDIELDEVNAKKVYDLLSITNKLDIAIRTNLVSVFDEPRLYPTEVKSVLTGIITVGKPPNSILRISLPPLRDVPYKGAYNIYWKTKDAIAYYNLEHPLEDIVGEKVMLIYKRYSTNLDIRHTCDNDNWEMQRVTNAISESFNYSDNAEHFSFVYTTVESEFDCVEVTLIREKDLKFFVDYLRDSTPAQPLQDLDLL